MLLKVDSEVTRINLNNSRANLNNSGNCSMKADSNDFDHFKFHWNNFKDKTAENTISKYYIVVFYNFQIKF